MDALILQQRLDSALLYGFVDAAYLAGRSPGEVTRALCDGGVDVLQLRAKDCDLEQVRRMAHEVASAMDGSECLLVVNDHRQVAHEVGAALCHLGQEDFFEAGHHHCRELKAAQGSPGIGLSTHSPQQALRSLAAEPSYIAIGPIFATGTKPGVPPVTLDYVRWASEHVHIPWFAIGGITLGNLDEVLAAGARRVCVVSAILSQTDISGACQAFRKRLASARRPEYGSGN